MGWICREHTRDCHIEQKFVFGLYSRKGVSGMFKRRHAISSCKCQKKIFNNGKRELNFCFSLVKRISLLCRTLATETQPSTSASPVQQPISRKPRLSAAIILNRSPILTRSPTRFEQAFYAYQARIRRALHQPFPYDFYFKQGSLLETRFNMEEKEREKAAFGSKFIIEGEEQWQDAAKVEANKAAVRVLAQQEGEGEPLTPREHPSDKSGDTKSLDRAGERNLYLLLKSKSNDKGVWRFPQGVLEKGDLLHQVSSGFFFWWLMA